MLDQTYSSSFQVEQVVDQKIIDGETHFLVKWVGYPHSENTWEPLRHMTNSKDKIKEWENYKITQLKLASDKRLHEELMTVFDRNKITGNPPKFKNISNPYKKVYLRIDDEEEQKFGDPKEGELKIQTIFDQPEMKKLIKSKKTERKKKELQMFERRLKTRPKTWEKYLQNEDQVIKRANQKIKEVIDKAYGRNINSDMQNSQKEIKKSISSELQKETTLNALIFKTASRQSLMEAKSGQEHKISNQTQKRQGLQFKETSKHLKKARTIFSSSEDEQEKTNQNQDRQKIVKIKVSNHLHRHQQTDKFNHTEASMEQETNFISLPEKRQSLKEIFRCKKQSFQNKKLSQICHSKKVNDEGIECQKSEKLSVCELLKGIVEEKKQKESSLNIDKKIESKVILSIKPETILLSETMIRKIKENKPISGQIKSFYERDGKRVWMSRISEQSERNSCLSKISSTSHHGIGNIPKKFKASFQHEINEQFRQQKHQEHLQINAKYVHESRQKFTNSLKIRLNPSTPFECSTSSIYSAQNRSSEFNSINQDTLLNDLLKSQDQDKIQSQNLSQFYVPSFSHHCSKQESQSDVQSSSESSSQNQEEISQRIINYSTFTNHVSTTLPEPSQQTQSGNRVGQIRILNLIRQQSMSTRASERTQLPENFTRQNSINKPSQSAVYELNQMQEILQREKQQILKIQPQQSQRIQQNSSKDQNNHLEVIQIKENESLIKDQVLDYFIQLNNQRRTYNFQPQERKKPSIEMFQAKNVNWIIEITDQGEKKIESKSFVESKRNLSKQEIDNQSLILKYDFSSASK